MTEGETSERAATRRKDGRGDSPEGGTAPDKARLAGSPEGTDGEWLPIASAPKDGTDILVAGFGLAAWQAVAHWKAGWRDDGRGTLSKVTHWRPLPPHPEGTAHDKPTNHQE